MCLILESLEPLRHILLLWQIGCLVKIYVSFFCSFTYLLECAFPGCRKQDFFFFEANLSSDVFPTGSEIHGGPSTRESLHMYNPPFHISSGVSNKFNYKKNKRKHFFICIARKKIALLGNWFIISFDLPFSISQSDYFKY